MVNAFGQSEDDSTYYSKYLGAQIDSLLDIAATYDDSIAALRSAIDSVPQDTTHYSVFDQVIGLVDTVAQLRIEIESVTPPDSTVYSSELTAAVNDQVTKSTTQTIAGEKTFSNSKTVFGGDSVGIRGKLDVDGKTNMDGLLEVDKVGIGGSISQYGIEVFSGLNIVDQPFRQFSILGYGLTNTISNYKFGFGTGGEVQWGLTNSSGSGIFSYNLEPYSFAFNSIYNTRSIIFGVNSIMKLGLFNGKVVMETDSLWFGSYQAYTYTPSTTVITADTLKFEATVLLNGNPLAAGGSVSNADSLGGVPASGYVTKAGIDTWSTNLYTSGATEMRLGKSYSNRRFNNGAYSDVWIIDYVVPPYNLSADWLYPIEHRTDYYNDTLNTVAHSDILNVDGTGTPIWKTNDVNIIGNEIQVNVGDLPDSTALNWTNAGLAGNKVILSEANKTAGATRFPMPVKGYEFKFGSTPYYTYPYVYGFYSDLTTNTPNLETAYHFYGLGDYPSYFGGDILSDGYGYFADSIVVGSSSTRIYPDSITIGGVRVAKVTDVSGADTTGLWSQINTQIEDWIDTNSDTSIYTQTEMDSLLALAGRVDTLCYSWGIMDTVITGDLIGYKVESNITIVKVSAYTDANTVTFNLEERVATTPNTAGTDAMASDLVADTDQQEQTSFSNANFAKNTWICPTISATGDVARFGVTVWYIKQSY